MINVSRSLSCLFLIVLSLAVYYGTKKAQRGGVKDLRPIAGLQAIDEAIGRATEMGRPINYSTGLAAIDGEKAAETFASMDILNYVSTRCARMDCNLIVTNANPVIYSIADAVVRQAYASENATDKLRPDAVRFLSSAQFAFSAQAMGIMHREKVAASMLIGRFGSEALHLAETGTQLGAIQIAGTENMYQLPFFVTACDYTLIGEELYASGAYLSGDPGRLGGIVGEDITKAICIVMAIVGSLLVTFDQKWLTDFFTKYGQ